MRWQKLILIGEHKSHGGKLVKVIVLKSNSEISDVSILGDFFIEPPDAITELCNCLKGLTLDNYEALIKALQSVVQDRGVKLYGIVIDDIVKAIEKAKPQGL